MRNQNSRACNYVGPTESGAQSRARARADSSDSAVSSKSKDQTAPEGRLPEQSGCSPDNICEPHDWEHVLLAKLASRTKKYHLPSVENPTRPACHHGTDDGRAIDAESWTQVSTDSPRLRDKSLCKWCDPNVEVPNTGGGQELAGKLDDLEPGELITDGGPDACTKCGVGPRGAFLVTVDGETFCEDCVDDQPCTRCGRGTTETTLAGEFKCRNCQERARDTTGSREVGQGSLGRYMTDGGEDGPITGDWPSADGAVVDADSVSETDESALSDDLREALEESDCHPDMVRYAEQAAERGRTPILESLQLFHRETSVSRIAEIGTPLEKTLWNDGAQATLDRHGHVDETNTEILRTVARDGYGAARTDGGESPGHAARNLALLRQAEQEGIDVDDEELTRLEEQADEGEDSGGDGA